MVALPEVVASNERIASTFPQGLIAVFVGGTNGVGENTVKTFAKYALKPRVYIIGRSQEAAERILKECKQLNPHGKFEFIKSDVSLLKNVDEVCRQIKTKEATINILFLSQGSMAFAKTTLEGLPVSASLTMHSRMRFILNLLPLLQKADFLRRVVSVLAGTYEGAIDTNNMLCKDFSLLKQRNQRASIQTLLLEEVGRRAPNVSFVHALPGLVKGGIQRENDMEGFGITMVMALGRLLEPILQTPPAECGERHLFLATSAKYTPKQGGAAISRIPLDDQLMVARGSDGNTGSGMYSVDNKGESASSKVEELLETFRKNGTAKKVWDYLATDFKEITGKEAI